MSKKLHLLVAALGLFIGSSVNAQQTTLSQTGGVGPHATEGSLSCGDSSNAQISENSYWRAYTIPANIVTVDAVKMGVRNVTGSVSIEVNLYNSSGAFPGSYPNGLTKIGTQTLNLSSANNQSVVDATFSAPVPVSTGDIIVVEVKNAAATNPNNTYGIGVSGGSETGSAYITAPTCGLTTMETITKVAADNNLSNVNPKVIIDLLVNETVSTQDFFAQNFSMYPNPVTDVLNVDSVNGLNANEIRVMDLTGKVLKVQKDASSVNVSDLATGTYLIEITTNEGKATSKFIKK